MYLNYHYVYPLSYFSRRICKEFHVIKINIMLLEKHYLFNVNNAVKNVCQTTLNDCTMVLIDRNQIISRITKRADEEEEGTSTRYSLG